MHTARKRAVSLFVDQSTHRWVVCDPDGRLWVLPTIDHAWEQRVPFQSTDDTLLEPVPAHYRYLLKLPF